MPEGKSQELAPSPQGRPERQGPISKLKTAITIRKEEKKVLDENKSAKERIDTMVKSLKVLLDSKEYKDQEETRAEFPQNGKTYIRRYSYFPGAEPGIYYSAHTDRNPSGEAYMVEVYARPHYGDQTRRAGEGEGYWRVYFHGPWSDYSSGKEKKHYSIGNTSLHGDLYLGDLSNEIDHIAVDNHRTDIQFKSINFGGYPSIIVWLQAWGINPKTGRDIGPIGRIREVKILGLARKLSPIKTAEVMESSGWETFELDEDFQMNGADFRFARGSSQVKVAKDGENVLVRVDGTRQKLPTRDDPRSELGPAYKEIRVPLSFANGFAVLSKFEQAATNLRVAFEKRKSQQLPPPQK